MKQFVPKLVVLIAALVLFIGAIVVILKASPAPVEDQTEPPPPPSGEDTPVVRSVVVSDEEVVPLLPLKGARLHFIPGNKIELGHESTSLRVTILFGVSGGLLWLNGIPSWLDLTMVDSNIDSYASRWTPAWSFTVDSSVTATSSVVPEDGIRTSDATPLFDWSAIAGEPGARYYLQVGDSQDFQPPIRIDEKMYDTHYKVKGDQALVDGKYFWRVMQRGRIWITGMPPWLDLSRYDPEVTEMPTVVSVETGDGTAQINYIIE